MKKSIFIATAMAGVLLISCGGDGGKSETKGNLEATIKPRSIKIKGHLSDYLEVVEGKTKVVAIEEYILYQINFSVKVKSIGITDEIFYGLEDDNNGPLHLTIIDDTGAPISGWDNISSIYSDDSKIQDLLKKEGEEYWITFNTTKNVSERGAIEKLFNEMVSFNTISKPKQKPEKEITASSTSSETTSKSGGSAEWDSLLDDYEEMYDDYIKLVKKAQKNDNSALSEYPKVYAKMITISQKLEKAGDDLSPEQITRFMEIQVNAMQAATELSK
ncbi:MAG: hypothetical protein COA97_05060 [Flavobacteriales bacterium]|nr:MAG: hypothetical protein COA97_05060 [Flavobacteriales bacterium]